MTADNKGNLKDQNLKNSSVKVYTEQEAYIYNNQEGGKDRAGKASHADKFIAANGVVDVEKRPGHYEEVESDKTDPTKKGEKLINAEGFQRTLDVTKLDLGLGVAGSVIGSMQNEAETKDIRVGIFIIINPSQTEQAKDAEASVRATMLHKQTNVTITVIPSNEQKKDNYQIQIAVVR